MDISAWLCTPEVKVLWQHMIFRMSSSFFQEPLRSSRPRTFMPRDLWEGKWGWAGGLGAANCTVPPAWRDLTRSAPREEVYLTVHMGEKSRGYLRLCRGDSTCVCKGGVQGADKSPRWCFVLLSPSSQLVTDLPWSPSAHMTKPQLLRLPRKLPTS